MIDSIIKKVVSNYIRKQVVQGDHDRKIGLLYKEISDAAHAEFIEDNYPTLDYFLEEIFAKNSLRTDRHNPRIADKELTIEEYKNFRMYIVVNEQYGPETAINSAAHGAMSAGYKWRHFPNFRGWRDNCFKKVTCLANEKELDNILSVADKNRIPYIKQTESRLDKAHILTVFYPFDATLREFKAFKYLRTYK